MMTTTLPKKSMERNGKKVSENEACDVRRPMSPEYISGLPPLRMPYTTKLSFEPLLKEWKSKVNSSDHAERLLAREIMKQVAEAAEFWEPIEDLSILDRHPGIVELLLAGLFPLNLRNTQLGKASKPFDLGAFYMTPAIREMTQGCAVKVKLEKSGEFLANTLITKACATILNQVYGQKLEIDPLIIITIEPQGQGLTYHFKSELNIQFIEVKPIKPIKKLSQEKINQLLSNIYDTEAWLDAIPPDAFEIHGVVGVNMVDVTQEETLSRLRFHLLQKDAVVKPENISKLEGLLRSYFRLPQLRIGLAALDYPADRQEEFRYKIRHCLLPDDRGCLLDPKNTHSVYDKACKYRETLLVEDLEKLEFKTPIEKGLLKIGLRSLLVSPLMNKNDEIIGLLEISSPNAFELNSFTELQFKELLPLFNIAVERSREETDNQVEAIVREKFTAIHPSVEWRFVESSFDYLERLETEGKKAVIEPIVFEEVYPLYAQSDIVNSSTTRNAAIQADFVKNLQLLKEVLEAAIKRVDFPLLQHYLMETEYRLGELDSELKSSDESLVIDFILREVHPLLEEVAKKDVAVALAFDKYQSRMDPHFGVVYQKRKDYEESVSRINNTISDYLDHEEERAQKMVSHYFEKYKTDGVQFELYAGQSLLRNGGFSNLHLRNLRLWQLMALCDITRQMEALKKDLPMPLSTAQLIFVYGQPLAIRFRMDEKRFDVDGAYNIRYEIIKKRIDKAYVMGADERLTQAGKIAIVYASEKDRQEYMEYLVNLRRSGLIEDDIEELELSQLQGVQGLKALRVTVKL